MKYFTPILLCLLTIAFVTGLARAQTSSSQPSRSTRKAAASDPTEAGMVSNGVYRNAAFGFACKIPAGWVLRTEEMNAPQDEPSATEGNRSSPAGTGHVLLAAFSRPPLARGEDVNSSILIAAEPVAEYPGLKDAAQYFGPLTEVAKAQGFEVDEEPYEFAVGAKALVRNDFEKNVGSRAMHQSTLVMLARGYAVSFTFIGGTEDEVEELLTGLNFAASKAK
jgi:hypothetical protein